MRALSLDFDWSFLRDVQKSSATDGWPEPPETCLALPGTKEKLRVMLRRIRTCTERCPKGCRGPKSAKHVGFQPCHIGDATWLDFARMYTEGHRNKNGSDQPVQMRIDGIGYRWSTTITPIDKELVEKAAANALQQISYLDGPPPGRVCKPKKGAG